MQIITFLVLATATTAPSAESIRDAVDRVVSRSDLQTELPAGAKRSTTTDRGGRGTSGSGRDIFSRQGSSSGTVGSIVGGILWAVLIAVGILFIVWLVLYLARARSGGRAATDADGEGTDDAAPIDPKVVTAPRADAEALAAQGRYAEAIHTLLLQTLQRLIDNARVSVPDSLTSREILDRVPLPDPAFAALGDLVGAVEVSHFGPDVPGQSDYARCRARFDVFAQAYTAGSR